MAKKREYYIKAIQTEYEKTLQDQENKETAIIQEPSFPESSFLHPFGDMFFFHRGPVLFQFIVVQGHTPFAELVHDHFIDWLLFTPAEGLYAFPDVPVHEKRQALKIFLIRIHIFFVAHVKWMQE